LPVLEHAVSTGLRFGYQRAFGGGAPPTPEQIWESQLSAIRDEVLEWFEFLEPVGAPDQVQLRGDSGQGQSGQTLQMKAVRT
jgi:hypothetical protein